MSVSSLSCVNRFTALSNVISGGLFSDFLCEKAAMNEKKKKAPSPNAVKYVANITYEAYIAHQDNARITL